MTIEENKALARRFIEEIFEQGRLEAAMDRVSKGLADAHIEIEEMRRDPHLPDARRQRSPSTGTSSTRPD